MFTLESVKWLASDAGSTVLERLAGENLSDGNTLRLLTSLRRDHSPERAGAALELAKLRIKAVDKFGADAHKMFFTREALEQASDPLIRKWRAYNPLNPIRMLDICCSIGSDGLAFAAAGWDVLGYDIDPVRVLMAGLNAEALGVSARFEIADVTEISLQARFIFYDPARRDHNGKRIFNVEEYIPPLSLTQNFHSNMWQVKLSPGVEPAQLDPYFTDTSYMDFYSVKGELKEALLGYDMGDVSFGQYPEGFLLKEAFLFTEEKVHRWDNEKAKIETVVSAPRQWLIEPDPALIRAGLVGDAAIKFNGTQLDESIAYFTTDEKPDSPWVRAWRILDWMPFNGKKLQAYLRERNVGTVTVKKRGTAVTPDVLIPQLKLKGSESRTLVLTRYQGQQIVMICEDYVP